MRGDERLAARSLAALLPLLEGLRWHPPGGGHLNSNMSIVDVHDYYIMTYYITFYVYLCYVSIMIYMIYYV